MMLIVVVNAVAFAAFLGMYVCNIVMLYSCTSGGIDVAAGKAASSVRLIPYSPTSRRFVLFVVLLLCATVGSLLTFSAGSQTHRRKVWYVALYQT